MKNLKTFIGIIGLVFIVTSCSKDSVASQGTMKIKATAVYANPNGRAASDVVLTSFKINIRKIEFKVGEGMGMGDGKSSGSHDGTEDGLFNGDDASELKGPWELDLLNQTAPITSVTIPNGTYTEVEFKLSPSLVSSSPIFNKTIEIRGTIKGVPFVFWNTSEQDFSIDYHDAMQNLVINNGSYDLVFNFDLNQVLSMVDLSGALDGNNDGIIEIGPNDSDGNNALATQLHDHIEDSCEMENEHH